jgi:hypothetical protein
MLKKKKEIILDFIHPDDLAISIKEVEKLAKDIR